MFVVNGTYKLMLAIEKEGKFSLVLDMAYQQNIFSYLIAKSLSYNDQNEGKWLLSKSWMMEFFKKNCVQKLSSDSVSLRLRFAYPLMIFGWMLADIAVTGQAYYQLLTTELNESDRKELGEIFQCAAERRIKLGKY